MVNYQMLVEEQTDTTMKINIGPQHPSTHGTLRLIIDLDGEKIANVETEIGFLHTGFEKIGESLNYNQFINVTDRMNYLSPLNNNIGYAIAVENLLGIETTKRCQYLRMIMAELSRISDHLISVGLMSMDLGAWAPFLWMFVEREKLYSIFEKITGARLTTTWTRIGGLSDDFPEGIEKEILDTLKTTTEAIDDVVVMLDRNRIWMDRTVGVGLISKEKALDWCTSGPVARASGLDYDIRRIKPYLCYDEIDFDVALRSNGDSYSRYQVRMQEIRESIKIVRQCLDKLPKGEVNTLDYKHILPEKELIYTNMESLIHHFKMVMPQSGFTIPKAEIYSATEAVNGELGFHIFSDGTDRPYRIHVRGPSLVNYQIFRSTLVGHYIADIPTILATLNIIAGELDR